MLCLYLAVFSYGILSILLFKTQATSSTSSASVSIIGAGIQGLDSQYYTYGQSGTPVTKWDSYLSSSAGVGSANGVTTTVSADFYASLFDALVALPQPGASWFYAYIDFAITSPAVAYYSWNLGAPNVAVGYMALTASSERKYTDYSPITNTLESISADEMAQRQEIADAQAEQSEKQHEDLKTGFQDDVFDSSVSSAGGSVDSYVKAEEELMNSQNKQINDYADQNFNTGLISNYMTAIASVSTWYTRIWMSFGDLKTVFTSDPVIGDRRYDYRPAPVWRIGEMFNFFKSVLNTISVLVTFLVSLVEGLISFLVTLAKAPLIWVRRLPLCRRRS